MQLAQGAVGLANQKIYDEKMKIIRKVLRANRGMFKKPHTPLSGFDRGKADGDEDGAHWAYLAALEDAYPAGLLEGETLGRQRDYNAGLAQGRLDGGAAGDRDGRSEGNLRGTVAGNEAAGLNHGAQAARNGSNPNHPSYQQGQTEGTNLGLEDARAEGERDCGDRRIE